MGIGKNKRLTERVLCSYRSTQSLRTSHNRGRFTVENGLTRRSRSPADGLLEDPRYSVVVLRRRDEQRVRFANRCFERLQRLRIPLIVDIGVVRRNITKTSECLNFHARRRQLDGGT